MNANLHSSLCLLRSQLRASQNKNRRRAHRQLPSSKVAVAYRTFVDARATIFESSSLSTEEYKREVKFVDL